MSDNGAEHSKFRSSIEEALELLGLRGGVSAAGGPFSVVDNAPPRYSSAPRSDDQDRSVSTEILRDADGVRRLHIHGCGRQPVRLSRSRCQAMLRSWEQLVGFAVHSGRPGTSLTQHAAIRDVNGVIVVEIGGEIGRPLRFTPEKMARVLKAREAIEDFVSL